VNGKKVKISADSTSLTTSTGDIEGSQKRKKMPRYEMLSDADPKRRLLDNKIACTQEECTCKDKISVATAR